MNDHNNKILSEVSQGLDAFNGYPPKLTSVEQHMSSALRKGLCLWRAHMWKLKTSLAMWHIGWTSTRAPGSHQFNSQSGHLLRLWAWSLVRVVIQEATEQCDVSLTSMFWFLPFSLNKKRDQCQSKTNTHKEVVSILDVTHEVTGPLSYVGVHSKARTCHGASVKASCNFLKGIRIHQK